MPQPEQNNCIPSSAPAATCQSIRRLLPTSLADAIYCLWHGGVDGPGRHLMMMSIKDYITHPPTFFLGAEHARTLLVRIHDEESLDAKSRALAADIVRAATGAENPLITLLQMLIENGYVPNLEVHPSRLVAV